MPVLGEAVTVLVDEVKTDKLPDADFLVPAGYREDVGAAEP
jgi:hypothetical protein